MLDLEFWKGKKVLVTGHTGFKGSWLCLLLNKLNAVVFGYALEPPTDPSLFSEAKIDKFVNSTIGDVRNYDKLFKAIEESRPEIVIHMAAQPLVRASYNIPVDTYAINVMGTVHLLEAIRNIPGIRAVVNVTTDKCYENREWPWGYRENEPMGGYDPYSSSKGCSELVTAAYRNSFFNHSNYSIHGVAVASARAGNVIGGGDWANDRLIPDFFRAISKGEEIELRSPYAIRPWQHVLEPLTGYLILAEKLYNEGTKYAQAWNFGPYDQDSKNVNWVTKTICSLWGEGASYRIDNNIQPHEANYLKLDCSKTITELGWTPRWNIETTLKTIVEWNKAFLAGANAEMLCYKQIESYYS